VEATCSKEYNYTKQALTLFRKAKGKVKVAAKYQKAANNSLLACKNLVAVFPTIILSNCNSARCAGVDQGANRNGLLSASKNITNTTKNILTQTIKLKKALKPAASKLNSKALNLEKINAKTIERIPSSTERCG